MKWSVKARLSINPVLLLPMVLPILFGAANAATGIFGAIAQDNAQRQQINSQNNYLRKSYNQQLRIRGMEWAQARASYGNKVIDYKEQLYENSLAANKAYVSQQARLNELFQQAGFKSQDRQIQQAQALGSIQARGVSGKSAARAEALTMAMFGRNAAIQQQGLTNAISAATRANKNTRDALRISNRNAYKQVMNPPVAPPPPLAPTLYNQPSQVGLFTGIGNSLLSGVQAGFQFNQLLG